MTIKGNHVTTSSSLSLSSSSSDVVLNKERESHHNGIRKACSNKRRVKGVERMGVGEEDNTRYYAIRNLMYNSKTELFMTMLSNSKKSPLAIS